VGLGAGAGVTAADTGAVVDIAGELPLDELLDPPQPLMPETDTKIASCANAVNALDR
jgi:hypothetical protein